MDRWKKCLLGDIVTFQRGYDLPKTKMNGGIYPVVASNGIIGYHDKFTTQEPSITVGRSGSVGKPLLIKGKSWSHNTTLYIREYKNVDPFFIYYFLKTLDLKNYAGGSAVPTLNRNHIHCLPVKIPTDILEQKRIASILSVYDELIENNQKQISLLEELAQRLYKEWFIDFHFPNYENTPVIDGVPNGWKRERLVDIANVIMGQSPKSKFYNKNKEGLPFHQGVGSYGTRFVLDEIYSTSFTRIAEAGSILFSVRAPVGRLNITKNKIVIGRGLSAINHKNGYQSYLFYLLKERFFRDNLIGNGSIFASISKDELLEQKFIIPDTKLVKKFDDIAKSIDDKINILDSQIIIAQEIRDRLLPKLMNGEINVSEFKFERNFI